MTLRLLTALLAWAVAAPATAQNPDDVLREAMRQAQARRVPVLIDFHAPWCYSCYYMARNVHNGPEWDEVQRGMVVLPLDADSPEGSHWMQAWDVKALPTYVVLRDNAEELGRILGEQTRADFYARLGAITAQANTLADLMARVRDESAGSLAAAREVLRIFHARYQGAEGLDWFIRLPAAWRTAIGRDAEAALWVARLEMLRAAHDNDAAACVKAGRAVLNASLGCERPYELSRFMTCAAELPEARRAELLRPQAERMRLLLDKRVFVESGRCADERSAVLTAADLYQAIGDPGSEALVLARAAADAQKRVGEDIGRDRNLADNLRVYLERGGKAEALDALFQRLIAAYPDDYVYAYRWGKSLAARDRHAEALPQFARAARLAYGVNRLRVAELWARSYRALGRRLDAQLLLAQALKENGPWFPEEAARLKALQEELAAPAS
ncbi:MAG: thioredoxin family protein [Gammaproteobacteria bacterium]|nr:thioredoxin family protein [Gammaproteobacteria bacterium]